VQGRIRSDYGDRATLMKTLQAEGITYEQYRERMREQVIVSVMKQKNVAAPVIVSPHKVEAYYQEHQDDYKVEDQVKLRMIVLTNAPDGGGPDTEKMVEEIRMKIKEGASFDDMAKVYSQGSERNHGGDWGWVERSVLRPELANAAFSLKPRELSDVVKIPNACCLMLVEDTRPSHSKPLSEVRKIIEQTLQFEERSRLEKEWIERLKKKTFVRIYP
jgi:parvulin-like peptidyl-prolyl isomerase